MHIAVDQTSKKARTAFLKKIILSRYSVTLLLLANLHSADVMLKSFVVPQVSSQNFLEKCLQIFSCPWSLDAKAALCKKLPSIMFEEPFNYSRLEFLLNSLVNTTWSW